VAIDLTDVPDISPEEFTFDRYTGTIGYGMYQILHPDYHILQPGFIIVGKCPASKLPMRPRLHLDEYGLMLIDTSDDTKVWLHYRREI